jgi:hypothetical protein
MQNRDVYIKQLLKRVIKSTYFSQPRECRPRLFPLDRRRGQNLKFELHFFQKDAHHTWGRVRLRHVAHARALYLLLLHIISPVAIYFSVVMR